MTDTLVYDPITVFSNLFIREPPTVLTDHYEPSFYGRLTNTINNLPHPVTQSTGGNQFFVGNRKYRIFGLLRVSFVILFEEVTGDGSSDFKTVDRFFFTNVPGRSHSA